MLLMALDCVSLCLWELTHHVAPHSPWTHSPCHSPQAGVLRDAGVGAKGWSGELKGPGSKLCAHVGSRGAGGVSLRGRLECHSMWPMGSRAGVGQNGSSTVELGGDCPGVSGRLSVAPREELWVGPGSLGEKAILLAVHWPVPRPEATLAFSMSCPVLLPLWLPKPLTPLLGGSPKVQAWSAAGVLHRCSGPGDKAGVSRLKDVVSVLETEAVTSDIGDGTSVGLSMSPAKTQPGSDGVSGLPRPSTATHQGNSRGTQAVPVGDSEYSTGPMYLVSQELSLKARRLLHLTSEDAPTVSRGSTQWLQNQNINAGLGSCRPQMGASGP